MVGLFKLKKKLCRYCKLFFTFFKCSLMNSLEYRFNFFFGGLFELAWMIMYIVLFNLIYANTNSIAGWTRYEILMLVAYTGFIDSTYTFLANAGVGETSLLVNQGTMDFILLKPINKQFYISFRKISIPQFYNIVIGVVLMIYFINKLNIDLNLYKIIIFIVLSVNTLFIMYNFFFIIMMLSFWFINMDFIYGLTPEVFTIGNKPIKIYPNILQKIFTYIIPLAVAFNYPVEFLVKGLNIQGIILCFVVSLGIFGVAQIVLRAGIKRYSSAGS
jgi:ABC-2 type transport system permease protein